MATPIPYNYQENEMLEEKNALVQDTIPSLERNKAPKGTCKLHHGWKRNVAAH